LAALLFHHIIRHEPETRIVTLTGWCTENEMTSSEWLRNKGWEFLPDSILMVDEAQGSYWDADFWNIIKSMNSRTLCRVITFASYGSGLAAFGPSPSISAECTVSLRPVPGRSVGLLLTRPEFDDLFVTFVGHRFDLSLVDSVFDLTNGHVGACVDIVNLISNHEVSTPLCVAIIG